MLEELIEKLNITQINYNGISYLIIPTEFKTFYIDMKYGVAWASLNSPMHYCIVPKTWRKFPVEDVIITKVLAIITGKYDPRRSGWMFDYPN